MLATHKNKKSFVFTRNDSLTKDENVEFASNVEEFTRKLVSSSEGNIWLVGGSELFSAFLEHKLAHRNVVEPIVAATIIFDI